MSYLAMPVGEIDQINKYLRHCFWRKYGSEEAGKAMISWERVYKLKSHGGLGVVDIHLHNKALLIKNLHKFFNKQNLPWVNLLWNHITPPTHHKTNSKVLFSGKHI